MRSLPTAALIAGLALATAGGAPVRSDNAGYRDLDDARLQQVIQQQHTEHEQVRLILLPATVTNRRGRVVRGLDAEDFRLFEDYVPQEIKYFGSQMREPISIAFLLDVSGSMAHLDKLDEASEAIRFFVESLRPGDQFGLAGFADGRLDWITEFTADRRRFLERLAVQRAYGQTALYDAVAAAPRLVNERADGRTAIVLFTDGIDNASSIDTFSATRLARSVNVPIYTVGFSSLPRKLQARSTSATILSMLRLFSRETGGMLFSVHDPDDLKEAVVRIEQELRMQYVIGYYPTRHVWGGEFRRVKLEATSGSLRVRTRRGYYANP